MAQQGEKQGEGPYREPPATRQEAQIRLIKKAFPDVGIDPPNWQETGRINYLYRTGVLLVRDRDLDRVRAVFDNEVGVEGGDIDGLTRIRPRRMPEGAPPADSDTLRFLLHVERQLGRGAARLEYLIWVTNAIPTSVSPCPAKEPTVVRPGTPPDPPVSVDRCDGRGTKVVVVDVGWSEAPGAYWLDGVRGDKEEPLDPTTGEIRPYAGHGTFIAGVVRCMAPRAEVVVKGVFTEAGATWETKLAAKLDEALAESPDIISLSAGTYTRQDIPLLGFDVLVEERLSHLKSVALVAAAGNDRTRTFFYPAAAAGAVSVGALAENRRDRASFSNFGGWVDVYAPGEDLVNAYLTGTYRCTEPPNVNDRREFDGMASWSGTSFATPLVAGLLAARMSNTGENARQAADTLLDFARTQTIPGVGPVLLPGQACVNLERCEPTCCYCGGKRR